MTAFEAAPLIKPPALPGVSDSFYTEAQSRYWEENIETLLRTYHDTTAALLPVN